MLNLEQLLRAHGHEVAVFAMDYPENLDTPWKKYFPGNMSKVMAFTRPFGSREVRSKFKALLDDFQPDVVHLNNVHTQLSPVMAEMAHDRDIRVVWTLHDYKLLCPRYDCLNESEERRVKSEKSNSRICELCFKGDKKACLEYKCMKGSKLASYIGYREAVTWGRERLENATDVFVCPSQFMAEKMVQGGFSKEKMRTLCNFIDVEKCKYSPTETTDDILTTNNTNFTKQRSTAEGKVNRANAVQREDEAGKIREIRGSSKKDIRGVLLPKKEEYYCFIGRLSHEKGAKTLVEAANQLPYKLVVIGGGPLMDELKAIAHDNIEFVGFKQWEDIKQLVGKARFSVIPSEWYENNPLSVIEAECLGTPVLGAHIGGIPELTDYTFESGNVADLKVKIEKMWNTQFDYKKLASESRARYDAENYYRQIMEFYKNA